MDLKVFYKESSAPYDKLSNLLHESFKERTDAGLDFGCATFSAEELKQNTLNSYIVCYYESDQPVAMTTLAIHKKFFLSYGWLEFVCVSPNYKHQGLGSQILKKSSDIAKSLGMHFLLSSTAIKAESSVRCHLKTGFKILSTVPYKGRNYLSYRFYYPFTTLAKIIFTIYLFVNKIKRHDKFYSWPCTVI